MNSGATTDTSSWWISTAPTIAGQTSFTYTWSTSGLPSGMTSAFTPPSTNAVGQATELLITTSASVPLGIYAANINTTYLDPTPETFGVVIPIAAPTVIGNNWPTITAGQTAAWSFKNTADGRLGALTWEVWSMLPDATSTSSWSANPSSTTTTLSVTTTTQTPSGDYAIGIGISPVTCQHSDDNASKVYVTIVSPATPAPATPMPIAGLCNPPTWPPGTNPSIILTTPSPGGSAPIQVTCVSTPPGSGGPGSTYSSILRRMQSSCQPQIVAVTIPATPLPAGAKIANMISKVECKAGWGIKGDHCAQALNQILKAALGHTIPQSGDTCTNAWKHSASKPGACSTGLVPDVAEAITHRYGYRISINQALPGDIDVQDDADPIKGQNHIGICLTNGCTQVLSNTGSKGLYCGITNPQMSNNGYTYPSNKTPYIYRITK